MIGVELLLGTVKLEPDIHLSCRRISCNTRTKACIKMSVPAAQEPPSLSGGGRNKKYCWKSFNCFRDPTRKGQKVEVESVHGGEDIWVSGSADFNFPEHLVVMVHGIIGSVDDWRYAADQFVKRHPDKVIVHRSACNTSRLTFDGVDLMGERLAEEVKSVVKHRPGVQRISFVAHSLGGLVARYAIGRLFEPLEEVKPPAVGSNSSAVSSNCLSEELLSYSTQLPKKYQEGKVAGLEPMNFITFATPHLGSRGHKQLPFLCGLPFLERRASQTAHWIAGRTGKHLFLTDKDDGRHPLLLRMVDDCDDLKFMSALCSFKRRVAYANANFDHIVGWSTSSIRRPHELPKQCLQKYENYPHIVYVETEKIENSNQGASSQVRGKTVELEEEMIRGLNQVTWERVDVSFRKSRQRYIAHNTIQVSLFQVDKHQRDFNSIHKISSTVPDRLKLLGFSTINR